jgi:predicted Zn-dependent protease
MCRVIAVVLLMMAMAGTAQAQADTSVRCAQWKAAMARQDSVAANQGAPRGNALLARPTSAASHGCLWAAVDGYVVGLQKDPRATSFWVSYAADILVNSLGRPDSAVSLYEHAAAQDTSDVDLFETMGAMYDQLHQPVAAHCAFVRAVIADSTRVLGWAGLARIAARAGQSSVALGYWARVLQIRRGYLTESPGDIGFDVPVPFRPEYIVEDQALYRRVSVEARDRPRATPVSAVRAEGPRCWQRWGKR